MKALRVLRPARLGACALFLLMAMTLPGVFGCAAQQGTSSESGSTHVVTPGQDGDEETVKQAYSEVLNPANVVSTFMGEEFYDKKIADQDDALAAIESVYDRIGADETTELEITAVRPTETGTTYYIFNQIAGDVRVHGAGVKLVVDKDGKATGLVSAVLPHVSLAKAEEWEVSASEAEQIVVRQCEEMGYSGAEIEEDATEQTLIEGAGGEWGYQYVWVVYTPNYDEDSEMGYLAHYVDANGEYLYALPISEPHNADAAMGDRANFDFDKYEQGTWTGTAVLHDGTKRDIEVPVLEDPETGVTIMGDAKRKILCADYAEWEYEGVLAPRVSDDASFDNVELLAYDTFIKVWDFYDGIGWKGPDGEGTPSLLLMDYVTKDREPVDNAFYMGRTNGFQGFAFNRLNPDGENVDVIAHEFTHCLTSTTMTTNLYLNDMGAINEGMSDIMGNLIEMLLTNNPESAWLIGDSSGEDLTLRSMKDPHAFRQPEFRWDTYYAPAVAVGTNTNDMGGVHTDSSMLSFISYKLDQAGMPPEDQFYFWTNVAMAMTPRTDYEQMAQLLPWCMRQVGYERYLGDLEKAIDEGSLADLRVPDAPSGDDGKVLFEFPAADMAAQGLVRFTLISAEGGSQIMTWPEAGEDEAACFVPAGDYRCHAAVGATSMNECAEYLYDGTSWKLRNDASIDSVDPIHVKAGETFSVSGEGLPTELDDVPSNQE